MVHTEQAKSALSFRFSFSHFPVFVECATISDDTTEVEQLSSFHNLLSKSTGTMFLVGVLVENFVNRISTDVALAKRRLLEIN